MCRLVRLSPVISMHLERKKGSPRNAVKLLFRMFIENVPNIQKKNFFREAISIKNTIWPFLDVPDDFPEVIVAFIIVSNYLDTC